MRGYLRLIAKPQIEPVTLDEALIHCHANAGVEDSWFFDAIEEAREVAEDYQRRAYVSQQWEYTFDKLPEFPLALPKAPAVSLDSVTLYGKGDESQAVAVTNFYLEQSEPARIMPVDDYEFPEIELRSMGAVKFVFTAGYGATAADVPKRVKNAMLLYIGWKYENRSGEGDELPKAFWDILRPERMAIS
jgi:uncharacterized phiE125 gp8 family phage protein